MNEVELKFKSNIKCAGCIAKVKPLFDQIEELEKWEVDIFTPNKILTIKGSEGIENEVRVAVLAAGFTIDKMEE
jgi:copper chaperone